MQVVKVRNSQTCIHSVAGKQNMFDMFGWRFIILKATGKVLEISTGRLIVNDPWKLTISSSIRVTFNRYFSGLPSL